MGHRMQENGKEQNAMYIVFISTNTYMGRMIRLFTRNRYSHVSVAFDRDLQTMYSFARYHIDSPILGGFVTEHPLRYLYGNGDVQVKICQISLSEKEYQRIRSEVDFFHRNSEMMIYNTLNALLSLVGKKLTTKNMFTCLEFVTYLLQYPDILAIRELEHRLSDSIVYHGSFRAVAKWQQSEEAEDEFFKRRRAAGIAFDTLYHVRRVATRVLQA